MLRRSCCAVRSRRARSDAPLPLNHMRGQGYGAHSVAHRSVAALRAASLQPLQREAGDFARVFQVEFVFDVCAVCLHGLGAEMQ